MFLLDYQCNFKKIIFNLGTGYETFTFEEIKTSDDKNITINKVSDSTNIIINSIKYHKSNEIEINVNDTSKPIELKSIVIQEINDNSEIKLKSNGKFYIQSIKFEDNKEDKGLYPLGRQYLEYAFIEDRYDVQILDEKGNDITEKFIEENKKYYKTGDWDTIMENFVKESGSMSTADKYIDDN